MWDASIGSSEAINALALIVSGTLVGYDMSNYNGHDPVTGAANMYYCASQQMCGNDGGGCGIPEFWYKMVPTIFMVQIADLYPGKGGLPGKVNAIADKLYDASVVMGGKKDPWTIPNYNHYSFNFSTMHLSMAVYGSSQTRLRLLRGLVTWRTPSPGIQII